MRAKAMVIVRLLAGILARAGTAAKSPHRGPPGWHLA